MLLENTRLRVRERERERDSPKDKQASACSRYGFWLSLLCMELSKARGANAEGTKTVSQMSHNDCSDYFGDVTEHLSNSQSLYCIALQRSVQPVDCVLCI
jgi:hypothetical protein